MRKPRDLGVLLGHALGRVDHDEADVRAVDGHGRAQHAVFFDALLDPGLFAHTGGVDEDIFAGLVFKVGVDGVARRARDVGDDDALLPENAVRQRGFADVRLADDGDLEHVALLLRLLLVGEVSDAGVEQVARAVAVDGGDRHRVAEAEVVELVVIGIRRADGVHLVDRQHDRLARAQQHIRDLLIGGRQTRFNIGQEDDDRRVLNGDLRLLAHEGQDLAVGARLDAAGVDEREFAAAPLAFAVNAVAGHAGRVLHDGKALADELIEQHRLADVRSADDGNDGLGHIAFLLSGVDFCIRAPAGK